MKHDYPVYMKEWQGWGLDLLFTDQTPDGNGNGKKKTFKLMAEITDTLRNTVLSFLRNGVDLQIWLCIFLKIQLLM